MPHWLVFMTVSAQDRATMVVCPLLVLVAIWSVAGITEGAECHGKVRTSSYISQSASALSIPQYLLSSPSSLLSSLTIIVITVIIIIVIGSVPYVFQPDANAKPNLNPIYTDPPRLVKTVSNGKRYTVGNGEDAFDIVHVWGER
jgi:hypothetical protein